MKHLLIVLVLLGCIFVHAEPEKTVDREAVRAVVKSNISEFKTCYKSEWDKDHSLEGKVILSWNVTDQGEVKDSKVDSTTLKNEKAETCMVGVLNGIKFPNAPVGKTMDIKYPFVFKKSNK